MNVVKKTILLFLLSVLCVQVSAQTGTISIDASDINTTPQWLRDVRRWTIVYFGSVPFTMFTSTFSMGMIRWYNFNGLNFADRTRAPWPLSSAGFVPMNSEEQARTIWVAAGLSAAVAVADMIVVQTRRRNARRRAEAIPVGTIVITHTPLPFEPEEEPEIAELEPVPEEHPNEQEL